MSVPVFGFSRFRFVIPLIIAGFLSLFVITPVQPSVSSPDAWPTDPNFDIPWSSGTSTVAHVQVAFNNARVAENLQLGTTIPSLTLPNQSTWDAMSDNGKAEWLVYRERVDRGLQPLHGFESNVTSIAQYYADYLIDNDKWGHNEDGNDPWARLNTNPTINGCHDWLGVAENLWAGFTTGTSIELPLECAARKAASRSNRVDDAVEGSKGRSPPPEPPFLNLLTVRSCVSQASAFGPSTIFDTSR